MPPVFGPVSPSNARLWSCAVASASACSPSQSAKNEASSPRMNSSTTTCGAGSAEAAAEHHVDGGQRLVQRHRDDDALAGSKPVGLDDDRRALRADIGLRRLGIVEALVGRGRNAVGAAQILGEALRAFELRGGFGRPERLDARGREIIDDACGERRLRPDHDQIDLVGLAERDHRGMVRDIERHAFGLARDARHCPARTRVSSAAGESAIFQASACSRPPEPSRRMFMNDCRSRIFGGFEAV